MAVAQSGFLRPSAVRIPVVDLGDDKSIQGMCIGKGYHRRNNTKDIRVGTLLF